MGLRLGQVLQLRAVLCRHDHVALFLLKIVDEPPNVRMRREELFVDDVVVALKMVVGTRTSRVGVMIP